MPSKFSVLARLFGRTENLVVTQLYQVAIGQPLFVEPRMGEILLNAYLQGAVDAPPPVRQDEQAAGSKIAVINVSGALSNRPAPGLCDDGPVNYETLRDTFDSVLEDSSVTAIVLRMDTPGGVAAGLFDFTDHVYASRGKKPIVAVVDDYAYSAGYAIAAAADEIWVSRTSGVGSVGVVAYHVDQSEYNKKIGVKVTPIYAGAQKIDFSPHFPLSEEAKQREQLEVDRLYTIFSESVARYRGLSVEAVRSTEAGIFYGPDAIAAKFADKLGTFRDAIASLSAPASNVMPPAATGAATVSNEKGEQAAVDAPKPGSTEEGAVRGSSSGPHVSQNEDPKAEEADALRVKGLITQRVTASGLPANLVMALLSLDLKEDEIDARIEHAKQIRDLCVAADLESCAESYVREHTSIEAARAALLEATASQGEELVTSLPAPGAAAPSLASRLDPISIYQKRAAK